MRLAQKSVTKSIDLKEKDIIDIAGVKYRVVENVPNTFSIGKRNLTLATVSDQSDNPESRLFIIAPSSLPMTIYKKQ